MCRLARGKQMSAVAYDHSANAHSAAGAERGLSYILAKAPIGSLLDVGAGTGTWLAAAQRRGITDVVGLDGVPTEGRELCVDKRLVIVADLRQPIDLGRKFGAALCLEVAEHLPEEAAATLVGTLCRHADYIAFSAAAPHQDGDHHVNCQWPRYWQALFNDRGFACHDDLRHTMWDDPLVEPWYRQNIFSARHDPALAGLEPQIASLIHPDMMASMLNPESPWARRYARLAQGDAAMATYVAHLATATRRKLGKRLGM